MTGMFSDIETCTFPGLVPGGQYVRLRYRLQVASVSYELLHFSKASSNENVLKFSASFYFLSVPKYLYYLWENDFHIINLEPK